MIVQLMPNLIIFTFLAGDSTHVRRNKIEAEVFMNELGCFDFEDVAVFGQSNQRFSIALDQ